MLFLPLVPTLALADMGVAAAANNVLEGVATAPGVRGGNKLSRLDMLLLRDAAAEAVTPVVVEDAATVEEEEEMGATTLEDEGVAAAALRAARAA